jgi:glucokinase
MGNKRADGAVVGVDMGGTKILAGVVNEAGEIMGLAKRPTKPADGPDRVIERIVKTIEDAVDNAGLDLADIKAVASGTPGPLDPDTGIVISAPNLGWENVPLAKELNRALKVPVWIENDVNIGTLGEAALGAGKGVQDLVGIFVGTGIGGGIILNGKLHQGWRKTAGEVGHMILLPEGPACGCGRRGCAEALASRTAIERDIWAGIENGRESVVPEIMKRDGKTRLTSGILAEALRRRDPLVSEVMGRAQFYLGLLVASIVNFIDPEMIILGGGVAEALGEDFIVPIRRVAYQYFMNQRDARSVRIVTARLGDNAGVLGASVYARQRLHDS